MSRLKSLKMSSSIPRFHPSEIAAVLGLNPYKSKEDVLLRIMGKMPQYKGKVVVPPTDRELVERADPELKIGLQDAIQAATAATSDYQIRKVIDTYEKSIRESGKEVDEKTIQALTSEIQKQRGVRLECRAEDSFGGVVSRSEYVKFSCPQYEITGYIDGMRDGKIVETKNRKRFWKEPPAYDFIQLRCYMKMKGEIDGILLENFPANEPRVTEITWSSSEWDKIHTGLLKVCDEIIRFEGQKRMSDYYK
jgi:hypothetical protein